MKRRYDHQSGAALKIFATRDLTLLPELLSLENRSFRSYYEGHRFDESSFKYYLKNDRTINVVATLRGKLAGYALGIAQRGSKSHIARIHSVAVDPTRRKRSIATGLIKKFVSLAIKAGCSVIITEAAAQNSAALTLLDKFGFVEYRHLPNYYAHKVNGIRLRLELNTSVR